MSDVVMPRLSDSMEEGTILKWLKADGDEVARGEELAEIETDKATMTYEADTAGTLSIVAQEGETLAIGEIIARIGAGGEPPAQEAPAEEAPAEDVPAAEQPPMREEEPAPSGAEPAPAPVAAPAAAPAQDDQADRNGGRPKASPVARRIARERNIDLAAVQGTGPGGRIVKADVESAQPGAAPAPAAAPSDAPAPAAAAAPPPPAPVVAESGTPKGDVTVEELTRTQQVIARRMAESKATVPEFAISTTIDMEGCVGLRGQLKAVAPEGGAVPSYNDMVVKACALALREYPRANGSYKDGRFELYSRVNVGVAVAADDALVVPTDLRRRPQGRLGEIARESRALAERVRAGASPRPSWAAARSRSRTSACSA